MSTSALGAAASSQVHAHHHYRRADTATSSTSAAAADPRSQLPPTDSTDASGTSSAAGSGTASNPGAGLQKFAAELQSILISAQSGTKATTTADNAATAADPAGATDPTAPPNAGGSTVRNVADRLQDLLAGGSGSVASQAAITDTSQPTSLQSVLDRLQSTLQQTLQSYGSAAANKASTSLTA